jgi:hypothetical protein
MPQQQREKAVMGIAGGVVQIDHFTIKTRKPDKV